MLNFSNFFLILSVIFTISCSSKGSDDDSSSGTPGKTVKKTVKKVKKQKIPHGNLVSKRKQKTIKYKDPQVSYFSLNFKNLRNHPFLMKNRDKIIKAAQKKGMLSVLLACGADFTKNVDKINILLKGISSKQLSGSFEVTGTFITPGISKCLSEQLKKQGYKVTVKSSGKSFVITKQNKKYQAVIGRDSIKLKTSDIPYPSDSSNASVKLQSFTAVNDDITIIIKNLRVPANYRPDPLIAGLKVKDEILDVRSRFVYENSQKALAVAMLAKKLMSGKINKNKNSRLADILNKLRIKNDKNSVLIEFIPTYKDLKILLGLFRLNVSITKMHSLNKKGKLNK